MTETVERLPESETDHPRGSVEWLIAQLNNADHIDGMVAEKLRAQSRALTASQEAIDTLQAENERLKDLLGRYSDHVADEEGRNCLRYIFDNHCITEEEANEIRSYSDARAALNAKRPAE